MKKCLALLLVVVSLFAFAGCSAQNPIEADEKVFSSNGLEITLTKGFREIDVTGYTACFDSSEIAVFALEEKISTIGDITLQEYADLVHTANAARLPSDVTMEQGITCMEYSFYNEDESTTYKYLATLFKADDAFWLVQFACELENYETYKPYFLNWAKTVNFD